MPRIFVPAMRYSGLLVVKCNVRCAHSPSFCDNLTRSHAYAIGCMVILSGPLCFTPFYVWLRVKYSRCQ